MTQEVFICDYLRTPIGRYAGALAQLRPDDMAASIIAELMQRNPSLPATAIDEVILGCANQSGEDNRNVARMAVLLAELPYSVPALTVNRLCASGMDAVLAATRQIMAAEADIIIAGGVESMSRAPFVMPKAELAFARNNVIYDTTIGWRFINPKMRDAYGVDSMPETAENVAEEYNISRADQDLFALASQQKAAASVARLRSEILPQRVDKHGTLCEQDEHPRADTTIEKLATLPTPFRVDGTITAGNASGINDGAAGLIIASATAVAQYDLKPLARIIGGASAGVLPRIMGIGPVEAVRKLCTRLQCQPSDFDIIEINEAFAAQVLASLRALGIADDAAHVNKNGGAIALGHPLGMSGARLVGTAALELSLGAGKRALATMCVGVGQGVAVALARV
ncbi:MAG: 3-oxoadipyl-CoA thiolase [Proteobacteria bacterium]|nr:3-oxoadipyl-CoA thiolase [Pseudomonadota bacterium]